MKRGWCPDVFSPMASGDGLLVRVKPPGGQLDAAASRLVGDAAARFGNGVVELTSRGNLQIRGLRAATVAEFAAAMVAAGLAHGDGAVERRRNVLVSPLAGVDPNIAAATSALGAELADEIAACHALAALPAKFQFAVDGGGTLPLADLRADIVLRAGPDGWCVGIDGGRRAVRGAADVAVRLAQGFLRLADADMTRMASCVARHGEAAVFAAAGLLPDADLPSAIATNPLDVGTLPDGVIALGLPFGRFDGALLADLATGFADGVVRLTPWRAVLLAGVARAARPAIARAAAGLILQAADPRAAIRACAGRPACASATVDARADAAWLALRNVPEHAGGLLHVSGCAKSCAHHGAAAVTLVGEAGRYRLLRHGRAGDAPIASGLTRDGVADLLRELAP